MKHRIQKNIPNNSKLRNLRKSPLILLSFFLYTICAFSQGNTRNITGVVLDEDGDSMIGVTVIEDGTNNGTITDASGAYSITVSQSNAVLKFSFIGFEDEYVPLPESNTVNVVLLESSSQLDEVVVIGYGSMNKRDLTGSVAQINTEDIVKAPVVSFDQALAGRVAGLQVSSSDGQPGEGANIVIRGPSSLTQSNTPLYVIDGFPIDDPDNAALNPEEIESITVLKDASSTAIYGARASNGVIVIETKKGVVNKPIVTLNTSIGFQQAVNKMEMMNPYEFINHQMEVNRTSTLRLYTPADLPETDAFYDPNGYTLEDYRNVKGIDWQDLLFQVSPIQLHNIAIRGGSPDSRYSISGSIADQEGVILNTGSRREQVRIALNQNITPKLRGGITANYSENRQHGQAVNDAGNAATAYLLFRAWGYRPVSGNPDINLLEYADDPENTNSADIRINPIISSENEHRIINTKSLLASAFADYDINSDLRLRVRGSYNSGHQERENFYNSNTPRGSLLYTSNTRGINANTDYRNYSSWSNENTLTFNKTIKKDHRVTVLVGNSLNESESRRLGFAVQDLPNEDIGMYGLDEGIPYETTANGYKSSQMSYFSRIDYNYKSKYLFTATIRADGSSRFSKENRWGYFPSAAIAWSIHEEDFMKKLPFISTSKIRVSYGHTGNNRVGDYQYLTRMGRSLVTAYSFNNQTPILGAYVSGIGNEHLKWETTEQLDVGLDLGLFKDRVSLTVDYYDRVTRDLLLNADMPNTSGFMTAFKNIGSLKNRGIEITLNTINIQKKNFHWSSNFNITFNNNEILSLTDNQESMITSMRVGSSFANLYTSRVGYPAGMFLGYVFDGIYQEEDFENHVLKSTIPNNGNARNLIEPGHIKYKDMNGDGVIDSNDMVIIGRGQPIHTGGFSNDLQYKGFSLSFLFQWSYGNHIYNVNRLMLEGSYINQYYTNQFATYTERWTPENRSNTLFKVGGQGPSGFQSTRVLEDGSYLRLKTVYFGYTLPAKLTEKVKMSNITLNVSGQNLLTFTRYSGMDPETSVRNSVLTPGYDYSAYPQARTVSFGINLTF